MYNTIYTKLVERNLGRGKTMLEIIGTSLKDVKQAERYGAERIELCQSMTESGTTPSYGLIKTTVEAVDIPINVIVRPHDHSFVYNDEDLETMIQDIRIIKDIGANGIVIGPITADKKVDIVTLEKLLAESEGLEVTFHRGFDRVNDQFEALDTILKYKEINTILTSGGTAKATDPDSNLKELIERTEDTHLTIMPGSGLQLDTLQHFVDKIKPKALHFGSGVRVNNSYAEGIDKDKVRKVKEIMQG